MGCRDFKDVEDLKNTVDDGNINIVCFFNSNGPNENKELAVHTVMASTIEDVKDKMNFYNADSAKDPDFYHWFRGQGIPFYEPIVLAWYKGKNIHGNNIVQGPRLGDFKVLLELCLKNTNQWDD